MIMPLSRHGIATAHDTFTRFLFATRHDDWPVPRRLLAIDPGETTGWAVFDAGQLYDCSQLPTMRVEMIEPLITISQPSHVICERYVVYPGKGDDHVLDALHTPQLIGAIKLICAQLAIPVLEQGAGHAKGFMTDKRLREWGYYQKSQKHANDAVRHGCFGLLCNKNLVG